MPAKSRHHLDKRADLILAVDGSPDQFDDLMSTREVAAWLRTSEQWLVLGRSKNYGPPYVRISTRRIAYRRDDVREWLKSRTFSCTNQYTQGAA